MKTHNDETCINCHFFIKECERHPLEISYQYREMARRQDYSWLNRYCSLACYRGIWDEGYNTDPARRNETIIETSRSGRCFFWEYTPGVLLPSAQELQAQSASRERPEDLRNQSLKECFKDFSDYVSSEKRMTFWRHETTQGRKWVSRPEQHAKNLLHTFLAGRFKDAISVFEEIRAGAGFIDLFIVMSRDIKVVVELKMCGKGYSQSRAQDGKEQLSHYMKNKQIENGYLLVFDGRARDQAHGFKESEIIEGLEIATLVVDVRPYVKQKDASTDV